MEYCNLGTDRVSRLGFGCMRLPNLGDRTRIDQRAAEALLDMAMAAGVNYFDTAYVYGGGASERAVAKALGKYPRDSYYLADKLPGWLLKEPEDVPRIFEESLRRCGTDYFDFYLCHNICDETVETYLDPRLGVLDYLEQQKKAGRIRHLGFSSHGSPALLRRFAEAHPWDFAQIQLNYLDWELQDAKTQYEILREKQLPIVVMEPVRGGRLTSLGQECDGMLFEIQPEKRIVSWAFRFLQSLPGVAVVLSGMNTPGQLLENLATFSRIEPLTVEEQQVLSAAAAHFRRQFTVPCTGCGYCEGCPMELDIPKILRAYNEYGISGRPEELDPIREMPGDRQPKACVGCGQCALHCPQHIDIPGKMLRLGEILTK